MSSALTKDLLIEIGSLWYCHGSPVKTFAQQFVLIIDFVGEDSRGNLIWKVYVSPRMILVSIYEVNLDNHFERIA